MAKFHSVVVGIGLSWLLAGATQAQEVRRTFSVVVADKVVGWQVEIEKASVEDGRALLDVAVESLVKLELLGAGVDQRVRQSWTLDAHTREVVRMRSEMQAGNDKLVVVGERDADGFTFRTEPSDKPTTIDPETAVIAPDARFLLRPEFAGCKQREFAWFLPEIGQSGRAIATAIDGEREFRLLDQKVRARGWSIEVPATGLAMSMFVDASGEIVRAEIPAMGMVIERATASAIERLQRVDITHLMVGKTNLRIDDPTPVTFAKVRVRIDATADVTAAGLTVPGQTFTGTVEDGHVDGVFEIRVPRHDGAGSLPFPLPATAVAAPELQPYLQPERFIESDDAAIAAQARELAQGAETSYEVVRRCADWVHQRIAYEIPGGGNAAKVFQTRRGECGGHSRLLAAMLRSLGIPARTPMGGAYVPLYGGSFGQHMWNEVWLGERIGWLPVDCTFGQSTFVDSTHLRLLDRATAFQPKLLEVLDWEPKSIAPAAPLARSTAPFPWAKGERWTYAWRRGSKPIGTETVTYEGDTGGEHTFASSLDLSSLGLTETVRTAVAIDGRLRSADVRRTVGTTETKLTMQVDGTRGAVEQQVGEAAQRHEVEVDDGTCALHNNCVAHFAILASRLPELGDGKETRVALLHDESHQLLGLRLRGEGAASIEIGGVATPVQKIGANLAGMKFELFVDARGRLLRWWQQQGDITVELRP